MSNRQDKTLANSTDRSSRDITLSAALLVLAVIITYGLIVLAPALNVGFCGDDFRNLETPKIEKWSDVPSAIAYSTAQGSRIISHGVFFVTGRALWDLDFRKWHSAVLIIWALDTILLFAFLARVLRDRLAAIIGAGIFAVSGALFFAQVWITGSGELIAAGFVFAAFLAHAKALDHLKETGKASQGLEILAVLLVLLALITKETMILAAVAFVLFDLFAVRRVTGAGVAVILLALAGIALSMGIIDTLHESYRITANPVTLVLNLLVFFYDPLLATGGEFWILDRLGVDQNIGALGELIKIAREHPAISSVLVFGIFLVAVLWVRVTLSGRRCSKTPPSAMRPLVPPIFGWVGWIVILLPVLFTPGHHYAYYLAVPFGILMIAAAPVFASALRDRRFRIPIGIALVLYVAWFPINTRLAFEYSTITRGAAEALECIEAIREMHPEIPPGTLIVLDGVDLDFQRAVYHGDAIEIYYPGTSCLAFVDLVEQTEHRSLKRINWDSAVFVFRKENGVWLDVTESTRVWFRERSRRLSFMQTR